MKIITEPTVHVLSVPMFFYHPEYELPTPEGYDGLRSISRPDQIPIDIHNLITHAGKGCYDSYGKDGRSIEDHISNLLNTRHGSVFEHANISLFLTGISRGCSHEIVRHRHFAFSQRSTRYTSEEDAAIVLDPFYADLYNHAFNERNNPDHKQMYCNDCNMLRYFINSCEHSIEAYGNTVKDLTINVPEGKSKTEIRKWARGKARQLLPHALETRMTMTGNLRAWRFFIEERTNRSAEAEIQRLAKKVFDTIQPLAPLVFSDFNLSTFDEYELYAVNKKI